VEAARRAPVVRARDRVASMMWRLEGFSCFRLRPAGTAHAGFKGTSQSAIPVPIYSEYDRVRYAPPCHWLPQWSICVGTSGLTRNSRVSPASALVVTRPDLREDETWPRMFEVVTGQSTVSSGSVKANRTEEHHQAYIEPSVRSKDLTSIAGG
jgi:hypothetical protein